MPVPEERLVPFRVHLQQAFPDWELAERWDGDTETHVFRLTRHREPVHLLKVSRELLDDNQPAELAVIVAQRNVAQALRDAPEHRVLVTSHGLQPLPPAQ